MKVCGFNQSYRLGGSLNNKKDDVNDIDFPGQSCLDVSSLLSFYTYYHSVWINKNFEAFAVGYNVKGKISSTLPKETFKNDTQVNLHNKNGQPCKFISAVCGADYTLYLVAGENKNDPFQLVYAHSDKETIFLNIGKRSPISIFGGRYASAVIDTTGSVIIITETIYESTNSEVECVKLPPGEKAVKAACCDKSVIVLCESHRVFECSLAPKAKNKTFSEVEYFKGKKINEISGTYQHFFAISEDCQIFGRGSNQFNKLGLPSDIEEVNEFTLVESLSKYHVIEASAGFNDSLFLTREGKILGCGWNDNGELMLKSGNKKKVFPPEETKVTSGATFCISGVATSVVFVGVETPPNSPNMKIKKFVSSSQPVKPEEVSELQKSLEMKDQEIFSLKNKLRESEKRIKELESENRQLRETKEKGKNGSEGKSGLEIIDTKTLDKLKRIKSLGRGATSEVFEVSREERLALKVYYPEVICSENDDDDDDEGEGKFVFNIENARRFLLEYESIAQIDHANIIKAFGISFGDSTHPPAILLEYCVSNLKKKIKKLTDSERICAIVDLSQAMKEVHSVGIIHRDLKLENILVDEHNKIKVSDFGLCTLMKVDTATMSRTQMTGTLKYMAPELLQERTDYDEKVDVYAFGVVVFQILMKGEFPKIGIAEVISGHQAAIPTSVSKFSSELIQRCWSYKSSDRPSFSEICVILKGNEDKLI